MFRQPDSSYTVQTISVGIAPAAVALGDLDGDGDIDLAVTNRFGPTVSVLHRQSDGSYTQTVIGGIGTDPYDIAVGDLDNDGDLDLAVVSTGFPPGSVLDSVGGEINLLLWGHDGHYTVRTIQTFAPNNAPFNLLTGDLDGDGDLDLLSGLSPMLRQLDGSYATLPAPSGIVIYSESITLADLDLDGDLDVIGVSTSDSVIVLRNQREGVSVRCTPPSTPNGFALLPAAPNPFNPTTTFGYQIPAIGTVRLDVFDLLGRRVRPLADEMKPAGSYTATFDATGLPSGVYLVRLTVAALGSGERFTATRRVLLAK